MARFLNSIATRMWLLAAVMAAVTLAVLLLTYYSATHYGMIARSNRMPLEVYTELKHLAASTKNPRYLQLANKYNDSFKTGDWAFVTTVAAISTIVGGLIGIVLARRISAPITSVAQAASRVAAGDRSVRADGAMASGETRELVESFNQMAIDIEAYERERTVLTAGIAHELRTPLTILSGRLHGLIDGVIDAGPGEAERLLRQVDQLARLVEDLRTLAHAEAGQLNLERGRIAPSDTIRLVVADLDQAAAATGVRISQYLDRLHISADAFRLSQIVANLLTNAIKHSPPGGLVTVAVQRDRADMLLRVIDEGPGLGSDDPAKFFLPFWRAGASRDAGRGGSGLGLALAARMAEAHGGSIVAIDRPDRSGAEFQMRIPLIE